MIRDYFLLSLGGIRHRGIRSWLTILGIFIGIAAVVSLISLGEGLQQAITGQFSVLGPDRLIVENIGTGFGPPGSTSVRKLTEDDVSIVEDINGVQDVIPRLIRVVKIEYNKVAEFSYVASMPDDQDKIDLIYETFNMKTESGRLFNPEDRGKIVLGSDFVEEDDFGKPIRVGTKLRIQDNDFEVVGVLQKASSFQVNSAILMSEEDLKEILDIGDELDLIVVTVSDAKESERVAEEITRALRRDRGQKEGEEDFSVQTPVQALESVNTILNIINIIVAGIAAISLLVGGIGITNTMYTSVLERTKEIGIMKAVGAKNSDILLIFLFESGLLGLVGGLVGAGLGLGIAFGMAAVLQTFLGDLSLKVQFSLPLFLASILFSLVIGIGSGILPAIQASRLNTVEALRK